MIRVLTACSLEPDDSDAAVSEILEQLDLGKNLLKNTAGLLFCYPDFIETGAAKAVCESLPFEVVGCTTHGAALPHISDEVILTLMVLTSDDVELKAGLSGPLETGAEERIEALYSGMRGSLTAEPSLAFALLPGDPCPFTGDRILETLDRLSGGVPFFGTTAIDMDHAGQPARLIHNGAAYSTRLGLVILAGGAKPRFLINSIVKQNIFYHKARITGAEGNRLISIDNMPAVQYMEKIGVLENGVIEALAAFPVLADPRDGREPRLQVFTGIDPDGALLCVSNVTAGSLLSIGTPTSGIVLESAAEIAAKIKEEQGQNGLLIFSCVSRNMALADPLAEMEALRKQLQDYPAPYLFAYSGGEVCPQYGPDSGTINKFHMYAIIACIF